MKVLCKNNCKQFLSISTIALIVFLSCSFVKSAVKLDTDLKYYVLKGEKNDNKQLMIFLHGMDNNPEMWKKFISNIDDHTLVIAVEAPYKMDTAKYRWYDIDITKKPFVSDNSQMIESTNKVKKLIAELKSKYNIQNNKVIISGFSQGAIVSLNYAFTFPSSIQGVGIFSGMLPDNIDNRIIPNEIEDVSFFITHGSMDKGIDISHAKKTKLFIQGKNEKIKMVETNGGHEITASQFQEFITWSENLNRK